MAKYPHVKVIILTSFADRDSVLPAIKAGAIGYQLKDIEPDVLVETIVAAMSDTKTLHPQVMDQLVSHITTGREENITIDSLTQREKKSYIRSH